jgi:gamma-glutamylaminecyclotransferase
MLIFIYGTLKPGFDNHFVIEDLIKQEQISAKTVLKFPMYSGDNYPYMEYQPGIGNRIKGVVVEINDEEIELIDFFESVDTGLYKRKTIEVETLKGDIIECECYFKGTNTNLKDKKLLSIWK